MTDAIDFQNLEVEDTEKEVIDLGKLTDLAAQMVALQGDLSRLEEQTKAKEAALKKLQEVEIPEMMARAKMNKFEMTDGSSIEITTDVYTSLPKVRKNEIFKEVRERGGGDMIKNELSIELGKNSDNAAKELKAKAEEMGFKASIEENIAPQTYKKWIKENEKGDKPLDLAFFGAYKLTKAVIVQ